MNIDKVAVFTAELNALLDRRSQLMQERDATQDLEQDKALSERITEVNSKLLPNLRKQIHDAFNAAKGTEKHLLSELIKRIDDALNGIGRFYDRDVSEARLSFLKRRQGEAKSHREAKQIATEIRAIEQARLQWGKQQEALAEERLRRNQNESELRRLDGIFDGQQSNKN
jgi:hypothetical protein